MAVQYDDDSVLDHLEPNDDFESDTPLEKADLGPLAEEAGKRPGAGITFVELQEQFALLEHQFELFREGWTRPPTRASEVEPPGAAAAAAAGEAAPRSRLPSGGGRVGAAAAVPAPPSEAPRSQSVPHGGRMLRNPSPADGRRTMVGAGPAEEPVRSRQPSAQAPPRPSRPPINAGGGGSPAPAVPPQRLRPGGSAADRRPPSGKVAEAAAPASAPAGAGKPPASSERKKKKKKVERPPWRDDFVVDSSPWSRELAQEQAEAQAAEGTAAGGNEVGGAAPDPQVVGSGRNHETVQERGRWRGGISGGGGGGGAGGRDTPPSPAPMVERGEAAAGAAAQVPAQTRRRPAPTTSASARAAAVAAAMEAGRQQQLLEQQRGLRQQESKGGMMLVIPAVPGAGAETPSQGPSSGGDPARSSPSRVSQIPTISLASDGGCRSESRPRTQQSRIPTLAGQQQSPHHEQHEHRQQHRQPHTQQGDGQGDNGRRQAASAIAPGAPATAAPAAGGGAAAGVDRLVVEGGVSSSMSCDDLIGNSADMAQTPPSSTSSNPQQQQRRRRQWDVPGAAAPAGLGGAGARRLSSSDGADDGVAAAAACAPGPGPGPGPGRPLLAAAPGAPALGRAYNPTPPASRPTSRPGSRPASRPNSRPNSNNGEALVPGAMHHSVVYPASPLAYTEQDARPHTSPERSAGGSRRLFNAPDYDGGCSSAGGGFLPRTDLALPDATFSAGLPGGLVAPSGRQSPAEPDGSGAALSSFHVQAADLMAGGATADLKPLVAAANGGGDRGGGDAGSGSGGPDKGGSGRGAVQGAVPAGVRDKEDYMRKLSALKRSVPHDPLRRVTEEGGAHLSPIGAPGGGGSGGGGSSGGGSAGQSRKWMDPGGADTPLSAALVEAVGSAPAAVRAARSRNLSADILGTGPGGSRAGGGREDAGDASGGADAKLSGAMDDAAAAAALLRLARPSKVRSQTHLQHQRSGSVGDVAAVPSVGGAGEAPSRPSEAGRCTPPLAHLQLPSECPMSPVRGRAPGSPAPDEPSKWPPSGSGSRQHPQQQQVGGAVPGAPHSGGGISAEQYLAFAVQNPEVAMAAAQAALNANGARTRARWNMPPPPSEPAAPPQPLPPGGAAPPPWVHLLPPQAAAAAGLPPQQQPLAAAMVSATNLGIPAVPLLCSPGHGQPPNSGPGSVNTLGDAHGLRRANSEGPRPPLGRGAAPALLDGLLQQQPGGPPTSAPSGSGPAGLPGMGAPVAGPMYGGHLPPPQQHVPPPPMVQGLFPAGSGGGPGGWQGPGAPADGMQDGGGRFPAYPAGGPYPSVLQPIRPAMVGPGELWAGGPGPGPAMPPHMHPHPGGLPPQGPSQPPWNGYGYGPPGGKPSGYMGGGPGVPGELPGPMGHTGPISDPYKPQLFKRSSNGHHEGFGGPGLGFASAPSGAPGPGCGSGLGPGAPSSDLPDYLRVSMSRMVAGWSAPNARHGALSGFNDVWQHRNNNRPPPGPGMPPPPPQQQQQPGMPPNSGGRMGPGAGGPAFGGEGAAQARALSGGGSSSGGGGGRETGFEGLSLAEVLASKPKKEVPTFKKKT